ncbi:uncharacterized protein LOC144872922 [Branchiostoma floridae x Branchiostoma japonicum]
MQTFLAKGISNYTGQVLCTVKTVVVRSSSTSSARQSFCSCSSDISARRRLSTLLTTSIMAAVRKVIDAIKDLYQNPFKRSLIVNFSLFVAGVWAARNLSDFDPMAPPQPAVTA